MYDSWALPHQGGVWQMGFFGLHIIVSGLIYSPYVLWGLVTITGVERYRVIRSRTTLYLHFLTPKVDQRETYREARLSRVGFPSKNCNQNCLFEFQTLRLIDRETPNIPCPFPPSFPMCVICIFSSRYFDPPQDED